MQRWAATKKALNNGHQLMYGFLAKGHLLRVSRQSVNDKGDNDEITGLGTDLLTFILTLGQGPEEIPFIIKFCIRRYLVVSVSDYRS